MSVFPICAGILLEFCLEQMALSTNGTLVVDNGSRLLIVVSPARLATSRFVVFDAMRHDVA